MQIQFEPRTIEPADAALIIAFSLPKVAKGMREAGRSREQFIEEMAKLAAQFWDADSAEKDT